MTSKYDYLAEKCFKKPYNQLIAENQIVIVDLYNSKEE